MKGRLGNGKCALDKMDHFGYGRNFVKSPGLDISPDKSRFDVLPGIKNPCHPGQRQKLSPTHVLRKGLSINLNLPALSDLPLKSVVRIKKGRNILLKYKKTYRKGFGL